jgi:hypothetical protein
MKIQLFHSISANLCMGNFAGVTGRHWSEGSYWAAVRADENHY